MQVKRLCPACKLDWLDLNIDFPSVQETTLRKYGNSDGEVQIVQPVNLAEFLDLPQAQRAMHAHLAS